MSTSTSHSNYGMLFNNVVIDPSSGMHIYVLPISIKNSRNQIVIPYSKCIMLARMYDLSEVVANNAQGTSCILFETFPKQRFAQYRESYNNVEEARKMIYKTYATKPHTYSGTVESANLVTDILLAQFNRCIVTEYRNTHGSETQYQPLALITLREVTNADSPKTVLLHEALSTGIRDIAKFWQDTADNLLINQNTGYLRHSSPQTTQVIKSNFVKMLTTVELYKLQQKTEYVTKTIREYSCLVIVKEYDGKYWAFYNNVNTLNCERGNSYIQQEISDLANAIRPLYLVGHIHARRIFAYHLPALRAYSMNRDKLAMMTDSFLVTWCGMFDFNTFSKNSAALDSECVRKLLATFADIMTGSKPKETTYRKQTSDLVLQHRVHDFELDDTILIDGLISIDIIRVYFVNIYDTYFKHLANGNNYSGQYIFQKVESIAKNLGFTIKFDIAYKLGQTATANSYKSQVEQDIQVYQKILNSIVFVTETERAFSDVSDSNVLGRVLLYSVEKNEKLISSIVTEQDCPLTVFAKMSGSQSTKETVPSVTNSLSGITISGNAFTISGNAFTNSNIDIRPSMTNNAVNQLKGDIEDFAKKTAAAIADRGSSRPSRLFAIPPSYHRNAQPSVADDIPNMNQADTPGTSESHQSTANEKPSVQPSSLFTRRL